MVIWFRHLVTDWLTLRKPELKELPFVLVTPVHNRSIVTAANPQAEALGVRVGMTAADAKVMTPMLAVIDHPPGKEVKLLRQLGLWCIRYTPTVATDLSNSLILDISGCTHLWGGEKDYIKAIIFKLRAQGYDARAAIADTIGTAWAIAHFGQVLPIVACGKQAEALMPLPPAALRLERHMLEKLHKLGFRTIKSFISMSRTALRRRFGENFIVRIGQALGTIDESLLPIVPPVPYVERLPCLEAIRTDKAISIAIEKLLNNLCARLLGEGKGVRRAVLTAYRLDGKKVQVSISTTRGSHSVSHLSQLFGLQISKIEPALGIELFLLEAQKVEDIDPIQEKLWTGNPNLDDSVLAELLDRIGGKIGPGRIHRYLPAEHYWPERSIYPAASLKDLPQTAWCIDRPRPIQLLAKPEPIEVMALLPDYPPKVFTHKGKRHVVDKADGPERIEREWWLEKGEHRDYYAVEDELGGRYWLFRSGHYDGEDAKWYLHGYFA